MSKTNAVRLTSDKIFKIGDALNRRRSEIQAQIDEGYPLELTQVWQEEIKSLAAIRDDLLLTVSAHDASVAERRARQLRAA